MTRCRVQVLSLIAFAFLLAGLPLAHAQQPAYPYNVDTNPSRGVMPNSEQLNGVLDSLDPVSRKLHIQIPLASLPAGHAGSGFDLALTYDSHLFNLVGTEVSQGHVGQMISSVLTGGGWHYNFQNYRIEAEQRYIPSWEQPYCEGDLQYVAEHERVFRYRVSLPDGSEHVLHLLGFGDEKGDGYYGDGFYAINMSGLRSNCASGNHGRYPSNVSGILTYFTTDGSYLRFQIQADGSSWINKQWTLFYPDGRRVVGKFDQAEHIYDANGNGVHVTKQTENGHTVAYVTDDFGRSIRVEFSLTSSSTEKEDRITVAGPSGPLEWRVKWQRIQIGGPGKSYVCYEENYPSNYEAHCPINLGAWAVKYIQLPLAAPLFTPPPVTPWTNFEFTYALPDDGYGRLLAMRVPGGAEYSYCCDVYEPWYDAQGIAGGGYTSRRVTHDGVSELWSYTQINLTSTRVTAPDGGQTVYHYYNPQVASEYWSRNLVYWIEEPDGTMQKRQWGRNKAFSLRAAINIDPNNPFVERESVTVDRVASQPRSAVTDYVVDKNGNTLEKSEYGWSNTFDGPQMESPGPLLRTTRTSYSLAVPESSDTANATNRYWNSSAPARLNAVARNTVTDEFGITRAITEYFYDDPLSKGNITYQRRWDDARAGCTSSIPLSASCPTQHRQFDAAGNLTNVFEPEIQTVISYSGGPYPTLVEYAPGTPASRSFAYAWSLESGALLSKTDVQNGTVTNFGYDSLGRQSLVEEAGLRQTQTVYDDEHRSMLVKRDLRSFGDGLLQTSSSSDQLGRVTLVQTSDGGPLENINDGIKVKTTYRSLSDGTMTVTSSPYRTLGDSSLEWTCTRKDQGGRVVAIARFRGSEPSDCVSATNRTGITVTDYHSPVGTPRSRVTDPAGRTVDRYADGLRRISTVIEDPAGSAYETTYSYDALDNLTRVIQSGSGVTQARSFAYTSLGQLRVSTNPESGTTQYSYNDGGDLLTRQDDRGYITAFGYDELHRVLSKTYLNDGDITPDVTYSWHTSAPCRGLLQSVVSSEGETHYDTCNVLGQITNQRQTISGAGTFEFSYSYWLNDNLKTLRYPSGKVVNYDVDNAGRELKVYTQSRVYADLSLIGLPYAPDGRVAKLKLGNDLWETRDYQAPGTPTSLRLGSYDGGADRLELVYNYAAASNNGNLLSHVVRQGSLAWSQTYEYDGLNRLTCATERTGSNPAPSCSTENSWRQVFGYDRFGNRWVTESSGFTVGDAHEFADEGLVDHWTNRVVGSTYDAAGNQTFYTPWSVSYDAENRMLSATSSNNGSSWFTYDGDGKRIKKVTATPAVQTTFYVYDVSGRLAAEYSTQSSPSGTVFLFSDLLGTPRAVTSDDGTILECPDYSPFGRLLLTPTRNLPCQGNPTHAPQQFTGQVRDSETKLDYFGARYFSAAQGRFLSSDGLAFRKGWTAEPQRWNRYAYALNNPLKYFDPDGKDAIAAFFLGEQYRDVSTWDVIFSKETITETTNGARTFFADHERMTHGFSPVPTSQNDLALQAIIPVGGKLANAVAEKMAARGVWKAPVIIGETMKRVKEAASRIPGAKYLDDMPDFKALGMNDQQTLSAMMEYNRKWLLKHLKDGHPIIDIGLDASRKTPSIYYQMEQNLLKTYKKLHPNFDNVVRP